MSTTSSIKSPTAPSKPTPPKQPAAPSSKSKTEESSAETTTGNDDTAKAIEKLEIRQKVVNTNNIARVANSQIASPDEKLQPLVSIKNGKPLEKFPETSKDIAKLNLTHINNLLSGLEAEKTGSEIARRERLRLHIGLKVNPA